MLPAKYVVAVAGVCVFAIASPTVAQSKNPSGASHGASLYWDVSNASTYRNVDGANNRSGFVIGVEEVGNFQMLTSHRRNSIGVPMVEPVVFTDLAVAGNTNEVLAWGWIPEPRFGSAAVLRYGAQRLNRTLLSGGNDEVGFIAASDPDANRIEVRDATYSSQIASLTRDGVERWRYSASFLTDQISFGNISFDSAGNTVAGGTAFENTVYFGRNIQRGQFLFKVGPKGEVLWLRHVMDSGFIYIVRTVGDGTVVLVAYARGPFTWAGQSYAPSADAPEFLLAATADGADLWARQLDNSSAPFLMKVHQGGQIAAAGGATGCNGTFVRNFDIAGNLLWERAFDPQGCDGRVRAMGVTFSDDDLVISGEMQGMVDLGFGPYPFPNQTGFYLGLSM